MQALTGHASGLFGCVVNGQFVFPECSSAAPSAGKEWEEYIQIRGLVEKIRKKQKGERMCTNIHTQYLTNPN